MKAHHLLLTLLFLLGLSGVIHAEIWRAQDFIVDVSPSAVLKFEDAQKKALNGDAKAQYDLGLMYALGQGVFEDDTEAVKWFRLAAGQGHARAQNNVGHRYDSGQGVFEDKTEAVKWYRLAVDQGYAPAQTNLAAMYAKENSARWECASQAGQAKTEYAAKQIEKTCLVKEGYKPEPESKGWFDW